MDSSEVSRQRAERLHADAVALGHDPCRPYAFARTEAKRRRIEVEKVPKGDVRLYGARALYERIGYVETGRTTEHGFTRVFYEKRL